MHQFQQAVINSHLNTLSRRSAAERVAFNAYQAAVGAQPYNQHAVETARADWQIEAAKVAALVELYLKLRQ